MIHKIRNREIYGHKISKEKNGIWFYRAVRIGIIAEDNKFIFIKDPALHEEDKEISNVFLMKGREKSTKKVWCCLLVEKHQMKDFIGNITNYTEKTRNYLATIANTYELKEYGEIICSGKGKISRSDLKKEIKNQCKSSDNPLLHNINFKHSMTCWNKIIQNISEILPTGERSYGQLRQK